jgi:hypothetical protein
MDMDEPVPMDAPDVAVVNARDPDGTAREPHAERIGRADQLSARERAASAGIELAHTRNAGSGR